MSGRTQGILYIYYNDDEANRAVYHLREGENIIGANAYNEVVIPYPGISGTHCKITITNGEYSIENISNSEGLYKQGTGDTRQMLKNAKEYELVPNKPYYLLNKHKIIFVPSPQSKYLVDFLN